jgi:hypothetical protein
LFTVNNKIIWSESTSSYVSMIGFMEKNKDDNGDDDYNEN